MFGSDGVYYNNNVDGSEITARESDNYVINKEYSNKMNLRVKALKEALNYQRNLPNNSALLYMKRKANNQNIQYKPLIDATEYIVSDCMRHYDESWAMGNMYGDLGIGSEYWKLKQEHNIGLDHYLGNIYGYDLGPRSMYFDRKLRKNKIINLITGKLDFNTRYEIQNYGVPNPLNNNGCEFHHINMDQFKTPL